MAAMKQHLLECHELLKAGEYESLLLKLKPWKDEAPSELWAVIAWLIVMEQGGEYIHHQKSEWTICPFCQDDEASCGACDDGHREVLG